MARRRSIYDASYQTPLADFLEQIPDYFLKWEALKQGEAERKEAKAFRDKQYSDAVTQQNKNNLFRQQQANYKKVNDAYNRQFNQIEAMDVSSDVKAKMFSDLNVRPEYEILKLDNTAINTQKEAMDGLKIQFTDFQADYRDISDMPDTDRFTNYPKIETLRDAMDSAERTYDGTTWEKEYDAMRNNLSTIITDISNKAGKPKGDKFFTIEDKRAISDYSSARSKVMAERDKNGAELVQSIAMYRAEGATDKEINEVSEIKELVSKKNLYNERIGEYDDKISAIQNKPEYRYPSITTSAELTQMSNVAKEQTRWVTEDAPDFHLYLPDDRLKLLGDEPVSAEEFADMKTRYEDAKAKEKETKELGEAFAKKLGIYEDIEEDIPPMWMEPATEPIEGAEVEEDIFADLSTELQLEAKKLQDRGMPDEQILAQLQEVAGGEPEPKPKTGTGFPRIAEPLTARGDEDIEEVVVEQKKKMTEKPLFPEPLVETGKYDVSDIAKGGKETGKVRRYTNKALGENLKQLKDLRDLMPEMKEKGQKTWVAQSEKTIEMLEKKIKDSIGKYINPDTGEFSNAQYTERIYSGLKETFPNLQIREIKDLLRALSTAKPYSKKVKKTFQAS